nr:hypothetical protein [Bradyrhizobium cenepequi]
MQRRHALHIIKLSIDRGWACSDIHLRHQPIEHGKPMGVEAHKGVFTH